MRFATTLTAICLIGSAALASGPGAKKHAEGVNYLPGGVMTYELFEASVDHIDLEYCPKHFDSEAVFCRMTTAAEQINIFVFDYEGDQPLLAVQHMEPGVLTEH